MAAIEKIFLLLSLGTVVLALVVAIWLFVGRQRAVQAGRRIPKSKGQVDAATVLAIAAFVFVTVTIVARTIESAHAPFASMYEFAVAFAWGVLLAGLVFRWRYKTAALQNIGLFIALLLLIFALVTYVKPANLVPALQQSFLLSAHVASAVVAYGTLTIGFGAAVLYIIQSRRHSIWLPDVEVLDTISYQSVLVGFPFLTLLIILGALWANVAWGRYWSWDPKETASLVTWLIYAGYMHARLVRGWRGIRTAVFLVAGFAAILLTFFGNYFFQGLHSYG